MLSQYRMKIGVFGSSFDPPTKAHKAIVDYFSNVFDEVWILPVYKHTYKTLCTSYEKRVEMVKLAFPDTVVLNVQSNACTADVVNAIKRSYKEHSFEFILGSDSFIDMISGDWVKCIEGTVNVVIRDTIHIMHKIKEQYLMTLRIRFSYVPDMPKISSTMARSSLTKDELMEYVSDEICDYIIEHNLYNFKKLYKPSNDPNSVVLE